MIAPPLSNERPSIDSSAVAPITIARRAARVASAARRALLVSAPLVVAACASEKMSPSEHGSTGQKALTFEALYGDGAQKIDFNGNPPARLVWLDDAHYLWPKTDAKTHKSEWLRVEAATGKSEPFADAAQAEAAMAAIPGVKKDGAARLAFSDPSALSADHTRVLITVETPAPASPAPSGAPGAKEKPKSPGSDLYAYTFGANKAVRLTNTPDDEEDNAQWSPDGKHVSFVRANDLYIVDLDPVAEHRITTDGGEMVLNGKLDWLYQEEVYGRGNFGAAWWSKDSRSIAWLRIDEHGVPPYTLVNDIPWRPEVEVSPYPRAGETNPTVKLGLASVVNGTVATSWVDLSKYSGGDFLIVDVAWSPRGQLFFEVQDREQTWLDVNAVEANAGAHAALRPAARFEDLLTAQGRVVHVTYEVKPGGFSPFAAMLDPESFEVATLAYRDSDPRLDALVPMHTLFRETSPAWVERPDELKWLADDSFLMTSERTGWKHLYHYKPDGTLIGAVTSGKWEARTLHGVDEKNGWVYFSGTERSPIGGDVYRVKLDGSGLKRLTEARGTHSASFNPAFTYFIDHWSNTTTPPQVRLHRADGGEARVIDENHVAALDEYRFTAPELLQVKTRDGFVMEAMLVKPPDFDPSKRYSVYQSTYAGPHAPQVRDAWGGTGGMFAQLVAQKGVVVWWCDNRTASGKGAESEWPVYKRFGETELADIEDGIAWLKKQPWVDASRIGIGGWSFGGFMTSYALTHSTSFSMGIAGGTVSDWANYDSIYTERYMLTPAHNPEGYKKSSVTAAAQNLHGDLLLIHGAIDDNVHPQSTMQLAYALQKDGTQFDFMLYPKSRHGVGPAQRNHLQRLMLDFIEAKLLHTGS
jgi:dipeptidyl-peptidase-4